MADKYMILDPNVIIADLRKAIEEKSISVDNAMSLVVYGMQILDRFKAVNGAEKSKYLIQVLETLAKGQDGIAGTDDDIIPPVVVKGVKTLLDGGLMQSTINMVHQLQNGTFPSVNVDDVKKCGLSIFECFKAK